MTDKLTVTCTAFKARCRNTLRGFATVSIREMRVTIFEVAVHEKNGKAWAQLPSRPWVKDGRVVTGDGGKAKYEPLFEFDSAAVRGVFFDAFIRAVLEFDPHALDCREEAA